MQIAIDLNQSKPSPMIYILEILKEEFIAWMH